MKNKNNTVKYTFNSVLTGQMDYLTNGNLIVKNVTLDKEFTKSEMQNMSKAFIGSNRIHKPLALLFWIDCKNGNFKSNWGNDDGK